MLSHRFKTRLEKALALDLPYPERPPLTTGTPASVLLLLGFEKDSEEAAVLITRRTDQVEKHKGQMAFPGGMREEGEDEREAALRETEEEVGIARDRIEILGQLPGLWTVTDFWVTPVVGFLTEPISTTLLRVNPQEIDETLWVPLKTLQDPKTYRKEWIERGAIRFPIHVYYVGEHRIWGATGSMLHNFLERLGYACRVSSTPP